MSDTLAERIARFAIRALPEKTYLGFVSQGKGLSADQITRYFSSPAGRTEVEDEILEEHADQIRENAIEEIKGLMEENTFEALEADDEALDEVIYAAEEHNDNNMVDDRWRETYSRLLRYKLDSNWSEYERFPQNSWRWDDEQMQQQMQSVADLLGVKLEWALAEGHYCKTVGEAIKALLENANGGSLELLWYGDPSDFIEYMEPHDEQRWVINGVLTFKDPHILLIDFYNGAGHDVQLKGLTVTVPFDASRIVDDEKPGFGYSWDKCAGLHKPAYKTDVKYHPFSSDHKLVPLT